MFFSTFFTNSQECKEDGKDYNFERCCGLMITDQHNLLKEGNVGGKNQAHFLKGKSEMDPMDRVCFDAST